MREPPPNLVSSKILSDVEMIISAGSTPDAAGSGEELFATIGLDFGTSATKVIVRFPYEAGIPAIAIPAPIHCQSMCHPYLWQTVLWINKFGEFKPWPEQDAHLLYTLKQGVMGQHAGAIILPRVEGTRDATRTDAAAAFLGFVIRYARGWLYTNRPQIFRRRQPVWFVNIGLPAASFDDVTLLSAYRRVAATALLLANFQGPITLESTGLFLAEPHVLRAARSAADAEALGVAVVPETAAEVAGFARSTSRAPGLYLLVDVGAMTLDACAFRLEQRASTEDLYALLAAQVHPLGVEAYHWFLGEGRTEAGFIQQTDRCLREVIWGTKRNRDPGAACWRLGNDLPVFLVGGGAQNDLHRRMVAALHPWLRQHVRNEGMRLLTLPIPTNIELPIPISDFTRLAVAWGLSYPPNDIGEILLPSALDDIPPPMVADLSNFFISKDHV